MPLLLPRIFESPSRFLIGRVQLGGEKSELRSPNSDLVGWQRIDPAGRERMAAGEPAGAQPYPARNAEALDRLDGVLAARRVKLAVADEERPHTRLVAANQKDRQLNCPASHDLDQSSESKDNRSNTVTVLAARYSRLSSATTQTSILCRPGSPSDF